MADDIRIKDLQSTASYMESDDYLPIDSLALGNRKIPFTGLMDSEDDRLPTTDKTPRGAITEHEEDISEIKQSLSDLTTGELGQMTKVGTKFNFGSQNVTLRIGRVMQCTLVITVTSAITDGETFIKLPKAMRIPCVFLLANDAGTLYKVGNTDSNSDQVKALYGSGLPAGNYRGSFMYLTVE